jgi:hypothetical protein
VGNWAFPEMQSQTPHFFPRRPPPHTLSSQRAELNSCNCGEHKGEFKILKGPSDLNKQQAEARSFLVVRKHRLCNLYLSGMAMPGFALKATPLGRMGPEHPITPPAQECGE